MRPMAVASAVLTVTLLCLGIAVATGQVGAPAGLLPDPGTTALAGPSPDRSTAADPGGQGVERSTRLQRRPDGSSGTPRRSGAASPSKAATLGPTELQPADPSERQLADEAESLSGADPLPGSVPSSAPLPSASSLPGAGSLPSASSLPSAGSVPGWEPPPVGEAARFRVASFNVLGASHTAPGGNKKGWAPASRRMVWAVQLLRGLRPDLIGFQELEVPQHRDFARLTHGRFGVFPGADRQRGSVRNSIAWDRSTWQLVRADSIPVPYFHGKRVLMPFVRLQHRSSGREVYVINIHNPATTRRWGDNERWRDLANAIEIRLVNRLRATTGLPVLLMGDFNERQEAFCRTTTQTNMQAANGGSSGAGPCRPPATAGIDWIFGSPGIRFSNYTRHQTGLVRQTTDHPVVGTGAELSAPGR